MTHDVYICYDENDTITADAICHVLEENRFKCWMKTRDIGVNPIAEEVMGAIKQSKVMVLIFSNYSKDSNFVNTEVDIAFTENIPILVFKIDESKLEGRLEFFLNNKHWLDAYPDPEIKFETLIIDTSKVLGKPISNPVIPEKTQKLAVSQQQKDSSKQQNKIAAPTSKQGLFSKNKTPIIIAIALIAVIAIVGGYFLLNNSFEMEESTLVLSDSAYMKVPDNPKATDKSTGDGLYTYKDEINGVNITSTSNISKNSAVKKINALKDSIKSDSEIVSEGNVVIYEKDGVYSIFVENDEYKDIILIQSTNKDLLLKCWHSIKFHNPSDSLKVEDDTSNVVNASKTTQTATEKSSYSSQSDSSSQTNSLGGSGSDSSSQNGGYYDWGSGSGSSGGSSSSSSGSSGGSSSHSSNSKSGGYSDWGSD